MRNLEGKITKTSNLAENDSLSAYDGHSAQQHHNVYSTFYKLIDDTKPKRILEIGTALGGLTMFMKKVVDSLDLNTNILTLDISARPWYDDMKQMGIDVRVEDIFDDYQDIPNEIKNFIKQDGLTIILCDGGDKIREFKLLSHFLKKGDIIMAHDYAPNQEYFDFYINGKIWNWLEIQDKDINESCMKHNLTPFMEYELRDVVWVGKIKQ
jgi:predicted O-methyltransferase YrrM